MKKSQVRKFRPWSAEHIIAHARWKAGRGGRPSLAYRGERNPRKALVLAKKMAQDTEFRDVAITSISNSSFSGDDGWSFCINENWGVTPKVGDVARFYGKGIGRMVRGLDINGVECYYRTDSQQRAEDRQWACNYEIEQRETFEKNKDELDAKYEALPEVFQRRIDKFRTNNQNFRWKYETYELLCCEQAIIIATAIRNQLIDEALARGISLEEAKKQIVERAPFAIEEFAQLPYEKQMEAIPGISDGHSGNSFGFSVRLAYFYVSGQSESVAKMHGALAHLVGSEEYGCVAKAV